MNTTSPVKEANVFEVNNAADRLNNFAARLNDSQFMPKDDPDGSMAIELIKAERLSKKLKTEIRDIKNPTRQEVKMLVDLYYQMQDNRKALRTQISAIESDESKKHNVQILDWCLKNSAILESGVNDVLQIICESSEVGRWLLSIVGIGPVLAAGCLAYFDVEGKEYATQFISYAGLNDNNRPFIGRKGAEAIMSELVPPNSKTPITDDIVAQYAIKTQWGFEYLRDKAWNDEKQKWSKSDLIAAAAKIPYNANLKTLCWKIGSSFQWQCNNPKSLYGTLFSQRRIQEIANNEAGKYADQAAHILATKNIGKNTTAYKEYSQGKLPKAHINARAMRWAEKLFLSHYFVECYRVRYGKNPPRYYSLEHCPGHHKDIEPEVPYTPIAGE